MAPMAPIDKKALGRRRGTPNKKGKKVECTLEKNQLKLFDFWERKSKLEPKDHHL